jgi:hypothetical protein
MYMIIPPLQSLENFLLDNVNKHSLSMPSSVTGPAIKSNSIQLLVPLVSFVVPNPWPEIGWNLIATRRWR